MEYFTRHPAEAAGSVFEESYAASRAASPTGLLSWSTWEVADYLGQLGLSQHVDAFVEADIDGEALSYLDADLLQDLGVRSVGQRLRLLRAVYDLRVQYVPQSFFLS